MEKTNSWRPEVNNELRFPCECVAFYSGKRLSRTVSDLIKDSLMSELEALICNHEDEIDPTLKKKIEEQIRKWEQRKKGAI